MGITQRGLSCLLDLKYESDPCLKTNHRLFHLQFSPPDLLDLRPIPHFNMGSEADDAMMQAASRCLSDVHRELENNMRKANWDGVSNGSNSCVEKPLETVMVQRLQPAATGGGGGGDLAATVRESDAVAHYTHQRTLTSSGAVAHRLRQAVAWR